MEFDSEGKIKVPVVSLNIKKINKEEIIFWKEKYDNEEDSYNKGEEWDLRASFNKNGFMSKEDLVRIMKWKFQGRLKGRQKIMLNLLEDCESSLIEKMSKEAFQSKEDDIRITLLSSLPAVKNSLSSVILTFYDPINYGILDIHSWRELFGIEPKDIFSNKKRLLIFFNELRKISQKTGLSCRDIEKALFKKNIDEA